jgi:hypothetical protein
VKKRGSAADVDWSHADGRHVVFGGEPAAVLDERVIELGPQQAMVDRLRDVVFA